ncbi:MAG: exodeoxyribonuclease VII large subunit [Anaerolineae bacterium]
MSELYSVTDLTRYIRDLFEADTSLRDVWVQGEVSNMKAAASGHWYFTVKDQGAALRCVMFRNSASRQVIEPRDGESIRVHGKVSVYEQRGEYQLYADAVQPAGGIGDLYLRFEQLKEQLQAEGLFDAERKRPLPAFPTRIGVVTSPDAAAFRDVQNVLARRFPLARVILSPTLVQGNEVPPMIVQALETFNRYDVADVILLVRGGGSIEDLWAFNDERVARAIVNSRLPIISGVGHETDTTIADFVADYRAPTPSAAAEVATPDADDLARELEFRTERIERLLTDQLNQRREKLTRAHRDLLTVAPTRYVQDMRQRVDELSERIDVHNRNRLTLWRERLVARRKALHNASPDALLKRGYAMITRAEDASMVTHTVDVSDGDAIVIRLQDGDLSARIGDSQLPYQHTLF